MSSTSLSGESACYAEARRVQEIDSSISTSSKKVPPNVSPSTATPSIVAYYLTLRNGDTKIRRHFSEGKRGYTVCLLVTD